MESYLEILSGFSSHLSLAIHSKSPLVTKSINQFKWDFFDLYMISFLLLNWRWRKYAIKEEKKKNQWELAQTLYPEATCLMDLGWLIGHVELIGVMWLALMRKQATTFRAFGTLWKQLFHSYM